MDNVQNCDSNIVAAPVWIAENTVVGIVALTTEHSLSPIGGTNFGCLIGIVY
jgi:hypothetical protein